MNVFLALSFKVLSAHLAVTRWFGFEPPVTPSPDEGRELLRRELLKPDYQEKRDWLHEFLLWLLNPLNRFFPKDAQIPTKPILILLIVVLLGVGAWLIYSRFLRSSKKEAPQVSDALVDPTIAPDEYRNQAMRLRVSDPEEAVKAAFRAIIARLDRSGLTSTAPGRTVGDVARTIGGRYPELRPAAQESASSFDIAAYALVTTGRVSSFDVDKVLNLDEKVMNRLQREGVQV